MALEWIVPMAIFGAFVSSSGATWMKRQRRLDEGRAKLRANGWVVPVFVRSTFPMDIRGEALVETSLDEASALAAIADCALDAGYERAAAQGITAAYRRGSEWKALSSFDLVDVPSEIALWVESPSPAGRTRIRCVVTYRTNAHYVSDEDVEQSTIEFSSIVRALRPVSITGAPPR